MPPRKRQPKKDRRSEPRPIERRIQFYRLGLGLDQHGRPKVIDPSRVLRSIEEIPWVDGTRYLTDPDGNGIGCWTDSEHRMRLGRIRRSDLPSLEINGQLRPIRVPTGGGIAEQTHIVFFNDNIIGLDFNFYGPRARRIPEYIVKKLPGDYPYMSVEMLLRDDISEQLDRLQDVTLFRLRIRRSYLSAVEDASASLGSAFSAAAAFSSAEDVELVLRHKPGGALRSNMLATVKKLARQVKIKESANTFKVRGHTNDERILEVDVLQDSLITKKTIARENSRGKALDHESAYHAIENSYDELKRQLERATGIVLDEFGRLPSAER